MNSEMNRLAVFIDSFIRETDIYVMKKPQELVLFGLDDYFGIMKEIEINGDPKPVETLLGKLFTGEMDRDGAQTLLDRLGHELWMKKSLSRANHLFADRKWNLMQLYRLRRLLKEREGDELHQVYETAVNTYKSILGYGMPLYTSEKEEPEKMSDLIPLTRESLARILYEETFLLDVSERIYTGFRYEAGSLVAETLTDVYLTEVEKYESIFVAEFHDKELSEELTEVFFNRMIYCLMDLPHPDIENQLYRCTEDTRGEMLS